MRLSLLIFLCSISLSCLSQSFSRQSIFAHNDYQKPEPFQNAYRERVGFIEADVFLRGDKLMVAHTRAEIKKERDLETMYLIPLAQKVRENNGYAYPNHEDQLTLMVDLKTDGKSTLERLVLILEMYADITSCKNLYVTVSGDMPSPDTWDQYPEFVHFDGRPSIIYTEDQLKRVRLVSSNFNDYSRWDGKKSLPLADEQTLKNAILKVHQLGKPIRFWAIPDERNAWTILSELGVDIINTDDIAGAVNWLRQ